MRDHEPTAAVRFRIRGATRNDEEGLLRIARFLNSVNLPDDQAAIRDLLALSEDSFSGACAPGKCQFVFVLEDLEAARIVGTSTIIRQKGTKHAPYIFFTVKREERYSPHLDRYFVHQLLELGFSYDGPTELGGLVVDPGYRRSPDKLGKLISYVRFLWIAMNRTQFRDELLAELLPPLEPDGTSHLWEAIGVHFTGLSYQEADKLSKHEKEFIRRLFPSEDIYASLLSKEAQNVIGRVGEQTRGVETMLRRAGFRYAHRVDPFDGGPHFVATTDEVSLIKNAQQVNLLENCAPTREEATVPDKSRRYLVAALMSGPPYLVAVPSSGERSAAGLRVPAETLAVFGMERSVWALELA